MTHRRLRRSLLFLCVCCPLASLAGAEIVSPPEPAADPFLSLEIRNVGPVNMSGRVADVEGVPGDPRIVWVGSASGGVFKSVDGGVRFEPVFDDQPVLSIGDVALAPSNPDVVYVGTGEGNPRNSVSFGRGVFKSTDGGATWQHLGLEKTRYITRIAVHPTDPDTVYVGALGSIFGPGEERGVFRSRDGGATWQKVLFLDDRHGVSDLDLDPKNPNVVFAALWHFDRKPWTHTSGSEEGGVFRSVDGGTTWTKLGGGLPSLMGRIGVKVAPSDPEVVYVIAESNDGVLFRSSDRGETFEKVHEDVRIVSRGLYYTDLRVDPTDADRVYAVSSRLFRSIDGGRSFERIARSIHVDFHGLWIDPTNPSRLWNGNDGGVAVSHDRGDTWEAVRTLPLAQFYQVFFDERQPFYALGGGLQDNGAWIGPSRTREPAGILPDDWRMMSFGDAYFVVPHAERVDLFLSESQGGGIVRTDMRTRQQIDVNPQTRRNDGGPVEDLEYRFNWNAPIIRSPHDPKTVYFAGNVVWKSTDFGDSWTRISDDLTTDDAKKQGVAGGPVWVENTTAEWHCTIISLAESPAEAGVLWVGTDDGQVQLSRDGGASWSNLTANLPVPAGSPVSHLEPSHVDGAIAYAAFDRHMFDDFAAHVFKTSDYGATWQPAGPGLPEEGWVWVLREDPRNPDVLYAGTEVGLYVSFDTGESWRRLRVGGLPAVSVHDVLVHPRENDLIVGSHGRSIFVFDDATPIQRFAEATEDEFGAHLFEVRDAMRFPRRFTRYGLGDKVMTRPNPPYGALISYYLGEDLGENQAAEQPATHAAQGDSTSSTEASPGTAPDAAEGLSEESRDRPSSPPLRIEILDVHDRVIRTLQELPTEAGLHRVAWDLAMDPPEPRRDDPEPAGDFASPPRGPRVLPGLYTARLTLTRPGGRVTVLEQPINVRVDPLVPLAEGALEGQLQAANRLRDARSKVNGVLRALDGVLVEMDDRAKSARRLGEELPVGFTAAKERTRELLDSLTRPEGVPRWAEGPRLAEHLADFFNSLDEAFAAPTVAQRAFLAELLAASQKAAADFGHLVGTTLEPLNSELEGSGLPRLALPVLPRGATTGSESGRP